MKSNYNVYEVRLVETIDGHTQCFSSMVSEGGVDNAVEDYKNYLDENLYKETKKDEVDLTLPHAKLVIKGVKPNSEIGQHTEYKNLYTRYYQ